MPKPQKTIFRKISTPRWIWEAPGADMGRSGQIVLLLRKSIFCVLGTLGQGGAWGEYHVPCEFVTKINALPWWGVLGEVAALQVCGLLACHGMP